MTQKTIPELFDLSGKTAIVTGGAMGIGYGIVKRLAEAGANVVIADLDEKTGKERAKTLGGKGMFVKTDVSAETDVKHLVDETVKKFGKLDVMVNNAGIFPQKKVTEMDVALWDKIQAVNMRGVFLGCREAARAVNADYANYSAHLFLAESYDALRDPKHPSEEACVKLEGLNTKPV